MKNVQFTFLVLFSCILFFTAKTQTKMISYDSAWHKIDQLLKQRGLIQSALSEVKNIYTRAKKEKKDAQLIKALVYRLQLTGLTAPDEDISGFSTIETEINAAGEPAKQVLQSIAAEMYWHFFQNNRWKLYDRTNTSGYDKEDINTWSIDEFHSKITALYIASLQNPPLLQKTKLEQFEPIINKGNTRKLRPAVYDLLAHRALDYFENDEKDITRPAYAFTINKNAAFDPVADFIHHKFITEDTTALQYKALLIYQELLQFHSNDKDYAALIDADLRRLQFVYRAAVMPDKDELYRLSLQHIASQYEKIPAAGQASYLLAQYLYNRATSYDKSKNKNNDQAIKTAKNICEAIIHKFPGTEGAANCQYLLNNILIKSLTLHTEKVNVPGEVFRSLVEYKNIDRCYFRIIKIDSSLKEQLQNRYEEGYWSKLTAQPAYRQWQQSLPAVEDYRDHSVEIKIDALPVGEYALLASITEKFGTQNNLLAAQYFYISAISYVNRENAYFVLHRNTGKPLADATVQVWTSGYDYTDRRNKLLKRTLLKTDKNGYFTINTPDLQNSNLRLEINWKKDHLFTDDHQYTYTRYDTFNKAEDPDDEKHNRRMFFFTDRSIYRPGQTVYFKGIGITKNKDTRKAVIVKEEDVVVKLFDANMQLVDSSTLKLSDYGSIHGSFHLPQQVLTGEFHITAETFNESEAIFSVEEYKRPKFQVELEKPKGSFRVNDTVSITGTAKAYAGNSIDGAKVVYRINRQARFIYPWLYYKRGLPRIANMEIAHGITTTDATGKFDIQFPAIPDMNLDSSLQPVFDYMVQVDVTDINGETRSSTAVVPVGYASVSLSINLSQQPVPADSMKYLKIGATNLSGEPATLLTTISVFPLKAPQRLIRNRYWEAPDQFLYSESEFVKYFPHDEYKNESDYHQWEKEPVAYSDTMTAYGNSKHLIKNKTFHPGWYMIEATAKDKYGAEVKAVSYIQLYDPASKTISSPAYNWQAVVKTTASPGEAATFYSGTTADDLLIIRETNKLIKDQHVPGYDFISLSNEKKISQIPVTEADRGGFGISEFFVKDNRFYINNLVVDVPWTNKELSVSFSTFRDKTEPGSQEKWEVKISGTKGEKVAAEMLASMYDASLDQFKPHAWEMPAIWPQYYNYNYWNGRYSFNQVQSQENNSIVEKSVSYEKEYDALLTAPPFKEIEELKMTSIRMDMSSEPASPPQSEQGITGGLAKRNASAEEPQNFKAEENTINELNSDIARTPEMNLSASPRTNFNETAFFFPDLKTDSTGNISFAFTMPEALTQWKLMAFAHTTELAMGYAQQTTVTQKELMVQPNPPRFLREKDSMAFSTKVVNISDRPINGFVKLELLDAATREPVDVLFQHAVSAKSFTIAPGQSVAVQFPIYIPADLNTAVLYRISASSSEQVNGKILADGEENVLPVFSNRILLTETMPLNMKGSGSKKFTFEKLLHSSASANSTLKNYGLTVEYTANPVWYAVQSLSYLMEYPYECAEQTFNRYYANMLTTGIANSSPRLKSIFDKWSSDTTKNKGLVSTLEKNEALKNILLQETPWLTEAKNETERMKQMAALFDIARMNREADANLQKLKDLQASNGGFTWFKGGNDDRYMTQYILTGIGHLQKLGLLSATNKTVWDDITHNALDYCDKRLSEEYSQLVNSKAGLNKNNLSRLVIQYLYMRSFFSTIATAEKTAFNYYMQQAKKYWLQQDKYMQGMIALALFRNDDKITAKAILSSLKQNAITSEEQGMYWKNQQTGYYWYEAPVEQQTLLIEAFSEINNDNTAVNAMKLWLLQQKQTQHWGSTKATAEACYALLLQGSDWLSAAPRVKINIGNKVFTSGNRDEEGTGYFQQQVDGAEVTADMGNINVTVSSKEKTPQDVPGWGSVYWQYFEDIDKATATGDSKMPLQLHKQLFVERNSDQGPVLYAVSDSSKLKVGDKLKVRIELKADRDMEYVHMKDLRAAGTEPVNVLSTYKWQGGLGYYESIKDASTNFFFSWLPKGTYVFEYPIWVAQSGNFSAGITTIQCLYAPEYISHSEGNRITVE